MESFKSMLEDLRERRGAFFALIAVVVIVAIYVIGSISSAQHDFLSKSPNGVSSDSSTVSSYVAGASTTGNNSSDQTSDSNSASQTPAVPLKIAAVTLDGTSWKCESGKVKLVVTSARVDASSSSGGIFKWQLEVAGGSIPYSPLNSSVSITRGQTSYKLIGGDPGYLYSSADAHDGQSVRVHVTSPNDISSIWFAVPAGTEASCAPPTQTNPAQ